MLKQSLIALLLTSIACAASYSFIDREVAFFVHQQRFNQYAILKWLTYIPEAFGYLAPIVLALGALQKSRGPLTRWQQTLFAAAISFAVTLAFLAVLKMVFGRYWPETWINNNPSLIGNGAYGFHFFHDGEAYSSFPSGHTARTMAVMSVLWIAYPRWRWFAALISGAVIVGLVGMDYHFVGDTIAGAFLGAIIGTYTTHFVIRGRNWDDRSAATRSLP